MNPGWGYATSLLNVEISLKCVTTGQLPSALWPIIIREALAHVRTWTNQAGMSKALSDLNQAIQTTLQFYIALSMVYVSPGDNLTHVSSRVPSASVCMLSLRVWKEIESCWGPHSIYLKALDSKAPTAAQGCRLIYFSLCPTKESAGVIVFSQPFHSLDNS